MTKTLELQGKQHLFHSLKSKQNNNNIEAHQEQNQQITERQIHKNMKTKTKTADET